MTTYYIAPSNETTDRDLAGEDNNFTDLASAHEAASSMNATCPLDGASWVVVGPSVGGGVEIVEA